MPGELTLAFEEPPVGESILEMVPGGKYIGRLNSVELNRL